MSMELVMGSVGNFHGHLGCAECYRGIVVDGRKEVEIEGGEVMSEK